MGVICYNYLNNVNVKKQLRSFFRMALLYILGALLVAVLAVIAPIAVTILIEYPLIIWGKVCNKKKFFVSLNALTNVAFNGIYIIFMILSEIFAFHGARIWFILAEAIIIPLVEAWLYLEVSNASRLRIYLLTYLANIASCALGIVVFGFSFI